MDWYEYIWNDIIKELNKRTREEDRKRSEDHANKIRAKIRG